MSDSNKNKNACEQAKKCWKNCGGACDENAVRDEQEANHKTTTESMKKVTSDKKVPADAQAANDMEHAPDEKTPANAKKAAGDKEYRTLSMVSDDELREAAAECHSYRSLCIRLGMYEKTKSYRIRQQLEKCGIHAEHLQHKARWKAFSREEIQEIANTCNTYAELAEKVGYKGAGATKSGMGKQIVDKLGLSFQSTSTQCRSHDNRKYDHDYIQAIVDECHTFVEVADKLGYATAGYIPKLLSKLEIDYSHFDPKYNQRGTKYTLDDLQENTHFSSRILKLLLSEIGITTCQLCHCEDIWNGKPIKLEVHHKNGNHSDNRIENLMLLCPTCHAYIERKGMSKTSHRSTFRRNLLQKRQWECETCHLQTWHHGPIPLEFHHKDGNNQNEIEENIALLCPNCHAQTKTFGSSKYKAPVPDELYIQALKDNQTIAQAIKSLGLSLTGNAQKRGKRLAQENSILHIIGATPDTIHEIINIIIQEQDIDTVMEIYGLSYRQAMAIVTGSHECSPENYAYPLYDAEQHEQVASKKTGEASKHKQHSCRKNTFKCTQCGTPISRYGMCLSCRKEARRAHIPTKEELKTLIRKYSFLEIGRQYNISGNAIVKWCKSMNLPWRKVDINSFTDEEWEQLEYFDDSMKKPRSRNHHEIVKLFKQYRSVKYISSLLDISVDAIEYVRQVENCHESPIEWSRTTCHIIGTNLFFRTTTDAGHWLAEQGTELQYVMPNERGRRVQRYIDKDTPLFGYRFEYIAEECYFNILEHQYEIISYAYQEERTILPKIEKPAH